MKKILLICLFELFAGNIHAQSVNAFTDIQNIKRLIDDAKLNESGTSARKLTGVILSYYADRNIDVLADIKKTFGAELALIVEKTLKSRDYSKLAVYMASNLTKTDFDAAGTTISELNELANKYTDNATKLATVLNYLKNKFPDVKKLVDQQGKLDQLTALMLTIKPIKNNLDTAITSKFKAQFSHSIDSLLAQGGLLNIDELDGAIIKLTDYQLHFTDYTSLTTAIDRLKIIVDLILTNKPNVMQSFLTSRGSGGIPVLDAAAINTAIGQIPQATLLPEAEKSIVSGSNTVEMKLVDAVAILLIEHAKKDLLMVFFQKIRSEAAKQPLLLDMFPHTYALLGEYPIYELPKFGRLWSHAIAEDLVDLPNNVAHGAYIQNRPEIIRSSAFNVFIDIIQIANRVKMRTTLPAMVNYYAANPDSLRTPYINDTFKALKMVFQECVTKDDIGKYVLIKPDALDQLNVNEMKIMLGMLAAKYPDVFSRFRDTFSPDNQAQVATLRRYLNNILTLVNNFNQTAVQPGSDSNKIQNNSSVFWDVLGELLKTANNSTIIKSVAADHAAFFKVAENCLNIYRQVEQKNYSAMVHESLQLIVTLTPQRFSAASLLVKTWKLDKDKQSAIFANMIQNFAKTDILISGEHKPGDVDQLKTLAKEIFATEGAKEILTSASADAFYEQILRLYNNAKVLPQGNKLINNAFINNLSRIGQFWTDVLSAQKSTELSAVIETYAVQPSSYLIKRNTRASVSFNAYLGAYFGSEWVQNTIKPVFGISAPIGVSFNWGFHRKEKVISEKSFLGRAGKLKSLNGASFSLNLSIVDIGAVASYRINNGNDGPLPQNFSVGQLLAPGLSLSYGIKGIPLSVSVGGQLTPQLRSLNNATQPQPSFRAYAGLFYDLPFHTFSMR